MNNQLVTEFAELWKEADQIWDQHDGEPAFFGYVSADYELVLQQLIELREKANSFLEWGSGLGVVAIMASRIGFDAYGIESEAGLVAYAVALAEKHAADSQFGEGSFIPDDFEWNPSQGDESERTVIDVPDAYGQLGMELRDFDVVYGYPWPTEHQLFQNILRQFGRPDTILVTYDAHEGVQSSRVADWG